MAWKIRIGAQHNHRLIAILLSYATFDEDASMSQRDFLVRCSRRKARPCGGASRRTSRRLRLACAMPCRGFDGLAVRHAEENRLAGKMGDALALDLIAPETGATYVMDRYRADFRRLHVFTQAAAIFVTRAKINNERSRMSQAPDNVTLRVSRARWARASVRPSARFSVVARYGPWGLCVWRRRPSRSFLGAHRGVLKLPDREFFCRRAGRISPRHDHA
jgi:hypothetical protein